MITVVLADNHPITRAGIRAALNGVPEIRIVGEAQNGIEAQEFLGQLRPHILLLDLKLPGLMPTEIEKWMRTNCPETVTLILTEYDFDAYLASMMKAGVSGYLTKTESPELLIDAIHRAVRGERLFTDKQLARVFIWREVAGDKWESLTDRERGVLRLLVHGLGNAVIGEKLDVTPKTVAYHVTNILKKLGVNSRLEAVVWANKYLPDDLE